MKVNVVRDSYAANNRETSAWDGWRDTSPELRAMPTDELPELDRLAQNPEQATGERLPPWLSGVV
jgi:hypothetical protein